MESVKLLWNLIRKYLRFVGWNVIFNILSALLSVFSLLLMIPFLQVLFYPEDQLINSSNLPQIPFVNSLYARWVDVLAVHGQQKALIVLCLSLILVFILKNGTRYLAAYFLIPVRTGVMRDLRSNIYHKLLSLDFEFYKKKRRGEIFTNFGNDVQEVEYGIISFIETGIKEPVTILVTLVSLILMSPYLTLWVVLLLPVSAFVIGKIGKQLKKDSFQAQYQLSVLQMMVDEVIHGIRIIQSFSSVNILLGKFRPVNREYRRLHAEMLKRKELASPLSEMLGITVVAIILLIGGNAILKGSSTLSPEVFITYIVVFSQIISPAKAFSNAWYFIQKGTASLSRIHELLKEETFYDNKAGHLSLKSFGDKLEVKNLTFSFKDKEVLKNISFTVRKGEKVAFVGPSGGGKTTLLHILSRIYDIPEGMVQIDGHDLNNIRINDYRNLYAIVTQDPILFFGTVEDNLRYARPEATTDEMLEALEQADALDFVIKLPLTLQTFIGERGQSLSIGQQQRLTLARAYLKNAPLLFLDEATSSLDGISDKFVQDFIKKISADKTILTIAHRLSTIYDYDKIIVLEKGAITGTGTHEELMHSHKLYQSMVASQAFEG